MYTNKKIDIQKRWPVDVNVLNTLDLTVEEMRNLNWLEKSRVTGPVLQATALSMQKNKKTVKEEEEVQQTGTATKWVYLTSYLPHTAAITLTVPEGARKDGITDGVRAEEGHMHKTFHRPYKMVGRGCNF